VVWVKEKRNFGRLEPRRSGGEDILLAGHVYSSLRLEWLWRVAARCAGLGVVTTWDKLEMWDAMYGEMSSSLDTKCHLESIHATFA